MLLSPYATFACTGYEVEKIGTELQNEISLDEYRAFKNLDNRLGNVVYALNSNIHFNPKPFAHPIDVIGDRNKGEFERAVTVIDVRPFTKMTQHHGAQVTKSIDYDVACRRGLLHGIWNTSDRFLITNVLPSILQVYASWISESICKRLDVDALTQLKISNIAAWWFWCQYNESADVTEVTRPRIYRSIADATRSSFESVEEDLDDIGYFDDITSFCLEVKERSNNPRVKHLDPASLIQLASGGWMGTWAREIMSVAIEYPPYFATVVYTALHERGMRSALFTKTVQRFATRPELKGFKNGIDQLSKKEDY